MPDKEQIIIDGVDVSECEFYNPYYCGMYIDGYGDSEGVCRDYEDCYYKQLARKTAECKEREQDAENWAYKAGLATGKASRYRKALEEIEGMLQVIMESNKVYPLQSNLYKILDILGNIYENTELLEDKC